MVIDRGDADAAIEAISREFGVAVASQGRHSFEADFRPLTDDEWERVRPFMRTYSEWLENSGAGPSIVEWRSQILERLGIEYGDEEE